MKGATFALSYIGGYPADKVGIHRIISTGIALVFAGMLVLGCQSIST